MKTQLFINKFEKGNSENANIGMGNLIGIDTYTKKGVAILAKKSTIVTTGFSAQPHFIELSSMGNYIWIQCSDGSVIYSSDGGTTFQPTNTAFTTSGHGNGLIFFQNFMFAFVDTKIYYWKDAATVSGTDPTNGAWVDWTTTKTLGALQSFATDPITSLHFPFLFPNNRGVYFGNGGAGGTTNAAVNSSTVGFFGQVGSTLFNPGGTLGTDFLWNNGILSLPSYTWTVGSINFLPPSQLAICVNQWQNPSQGANLITWDTVSSNKFNPPLQIFSNINSTDTATITAGIKQIFNRNQVLYTVTGGNHSIYETNGSSFNFLEDIGLYSNLRLTAGAEIDYPVFFNSYPQAITVIGNKLLTGVAPMTNTATYPPNSIIGAGIFPIGVWSIAFDKSGSHSTQCEFILPLGSSLVSPGQTGNYEKITCIKSIPSEVGANTTSQFIIGFSYNTVASPNTFGVAIVDNFNYIDDINYTAIESELFEIGTALKPETVNNIEINLVKKLLPGQTIDISYRTGQDQSWTVIDTYNGDGTLNYYALTKNPIGSTQFIQLRARMATGSPNQKYSPQLKSIILS